MESTQGGEIAFFGFIVIVLFEFGWGFFCNLALNWILDHKEAYMAVYVLGLSLLYIIVALLPMFFFVCRKDALAIYGLLLVAAIPVVIRFGGRLLHDGDERKQNHDLRFHNPS